MTPVRIDALSRDPWLVSLTPDYRLLTPVLTNYQLPATRFFSLPSPPRPQWPPAAAARRFQTVACRCRRATRPPAAYSIAPAVARRARETPTSLWRKPG